MIVITLLRDVTYPFNSNFLYDFDLIIAIYMSFICYTSYNMCRIMRKLPGCWGEQWIRFTTRNKQNDRKNSYICILYLFMISIHSTNEKCLLYAVYVSSKSELRLDLQPRHSKFHFDLRWIELRALTAVIQQKSFGILNHHANSSLTITELSLCFYFVTIII